MLFLEIAHRREVAPAELPDDVISVVEEVSDLDGVVASLLVVTRCFLLVVIRAEDLLLLLVFLHTHSQQDTDEMVKLTTLESGLAELRKTDQVHGVQGSEIRGIKKNWLTFVNN